jgi:hypothetical protein
MTENQLLLANEINLEIQDLTDEVKHFEKLLEILDKKKANEIDPIEMTVESFGSAGSHEIYFDQGILKDALLKNLSMTNNKIEALNIEFKNL